MQRFLIPNRYTGAASGSPVNMDRCKGMLCAVAVGDALGATTEFARTIPRLEYTDILCDQDMSIQFKWSSVVLPAAAYTDDTEMSLALLQSLLANNRLSYDLDRAALAYMAFANQSSMLGKNTRRLFKGVSRVAGYKARVAKLGPAAMAQSESNGSLMRASPLALLPTYDVEAIRSDTSLTNPNPVSIACTLLYVKLLRLLLAGQSKATCKQECEQFASSDDNPTSVRAAVSDSLAEECTRDITFRGPGKGWVCNSLYIALRSFWRHATFADAMRFVIRDHPGSDTDTNAAIAGALFGAHLGFDALKLEVAFQTNLAKVKAAAIKRRCPYQLQDALWTQLERASGGVTQARKRAASPETVARKDSSPKRVRTAVSR